MLAAQIHARGRVLQKIGLKSLSKMPDKKLCFVIGPIGEPESEPRIHADWLLEGIIEPVLAEFPDFRVKRADQDPRPGLIDAQLINDLLNAELVIADLSFLNPNVYYEIGIRHMAQKPIIHMQLSTEKPPFDLSLYRAIKFSRAKYRDLGHAQAELRRAIQSVLEKDYEIDNPVTSARGRVKLNESATSEQKIFIDQFDALGERLEMLEDQIRFLYPDNLLAQPGRDVPFASLVMNIRVKPKDGTNGVFEMIRSWMLRNFSNIFTTKLVKDELSINVLANRANVERARKIMLEENWPSEIIKSFRVANVRNANAPVPDQLTD
jgi:hypothetical protein